VAQPAAESPEGTGLRSIAAKQAGPSKRPTS
jgi:hypothetical protein